VGKNAYDEAYFEGRNSNYWWTVGNYGNLRRFPHWEEMLKLIQEFRRGGRLLDVGCAYGLLVNVASKRFESYGIDISRFAVKKSKEYCRGDISRASAVSLPFRDESFDVITIIDTLEHVPDFNRCLKDIVRVLKKAGILLLQLPNPLIWAHLCGNLGLEDETHVNNFRLEQWQEILRERGLKIEKCFGFIAFAFKEVKFFAKLERAASFFPELWIIAKK
jgi:ubiquinone/menaquinone biosynthesis C-methylase UbiE